MSVRRQGRTNGVCLTYFSAVLWKAMAAFQARGCRSLVHASIKTFCVELRHAQLWAADLLVTGERGEVAQRRGHRRLRVVQPVHGGDAHVGNFHPNTHFGFDVLRVG